MPMLDMPLEELKVYRGSSPCPADFDAYWEKALAELDSVEPQAEIKKAAVQFTNFICYDLYFTGVNGARVYAKHIVPANYTGKLGAILNFHGYSGESAEFSGLVHYAAMGFAVFAMDVRGQGSGKSEDVGGYKGSTYKGQFVRGLDNADPQKMMFRDVFLDTAQLAKVAMSLDYIDETNVSACGGSQGGALTLACAALVPNLKQALAAYPFLCDYKRVWDMDLDKGAYEELRTYFRYADPTHAREEETFMRLGYIDVANLAPRIRAKVTMFTGLLDSTCPPSTQFAAYNRMTCEKEMIIYPDYGHEYIRGRDDVEAMLLCK